MYKVEVDTDRKFIRVEISGFFKLEDIDSMRAELENSFKLFKPKEAKLLFKLIGFKPVSTQIGPALEKLNVWLSNSAGQMVAVNDSAMSRQQVDRLAENIKNNVVRCSTEEEAMKYLFG